VHARVAVDDAAQFAARSRSSRATSSRRTRRTSECSASITGVYATDLRDLRRRSEGRRREALAARGAVAAQRLPEALVGGDDQPVRVADHGAGAAARRDHHPDVSAFQVSALFVIELRAVPAHLSCRPGLGRTGCRGDRS
jgi:hypothetical protein